jgi:hypothetical protein
MTHVKNMIPQIKNEVGDVVILTILIPLIHKYERYLHIIVSSTISFFSTL